MRRFELTDEQWGKIKQLLPGKEGDSGRTAKDNRLFIDAMLWTARTAAQWRDLPARFGKTSSRSDGVWRTLNSTWLKCDHRGQCKPIQTSRCKIGAIESVKIKHDKQAGCVYGRIRNILAFELL